MQFDDTPEEALFRAEVRSWLDANARRRAPGESRSIVETDEASLLEQARAWQRRKAAAGFVNLTWPTEYGCRGGRAIEQIIFDMEESGYDVPLSFFKIGLGMCMPTMLAYASEEQKRRYIPPALRGDEIWCQMFSEPAAGSDLAAVRLRAVRDGDDWLLNGQKIWISGAHFSDYGIVLTRTDPSAAKHAGLTMFFVDMKMPGIECRKIRHIGGAATFNEVFFTDARVPDTQRLGPVDGGWKVALTTLMNERLSIMSATTIPEFDALFALCRTVDVDGRPALERADVREKLADWYVAEQGLRFMRFRLMTAVSRGGMPGPEASMMKLVNAARQQDISSFALDLLDAAGIVDDPGTAPLRGAFHRAFFWTNGQRIAGGTDEILRNVLAERVLGLPPEPRGDKPAAAAL